MYCIYLRVNHFYSSSINRIHFMVDKGAHLLRGAHHLAFVHVFYNGPIRGLWYVVLCAGSYITLCCWSNKLRNIGSDVNVYQMGKMQ